ncbi:MAG: phenylacetate--CoA ligase family protein [Alphaproteobacteria bacterium]|nr:phenylacetate--CoA ligase family protein [Alphaproteobacteria bacterium]
MTASAQAAPYYHRSLDFEALCKSYPPAGDYLQTVHAMSRDELRSVQESRFLAQMKRAWQVPFFQHHWGKAGMQPGDVRSLEDLARIPPYTVHDLRASIERAPPFGDHIGIDWETADPMPLLLQTSGGTTGLPRPMIYTPQDRETMNILSSRRLWMQGVRPFDRVQVALTLGLANGGLLGREALWKYSGAIPIMTGSGVVTPTRRQIEILKAWGTNVLVAFPAYLRHMALVARDELGLEPSRLGIKAVLTHLGVDSRERLEELWGAPVYDCYGTNECGAIAADCEQRTGMHVFEDAFAVEIADQESMKPAAPGEKGTVFLTTLFKYAAPVIRFDSGDVSAMLAGNCACGGTHMRMDRIFGRNDGMIKLRGVNVFPEAVGAIVDRHANCNGEYVCLVERKGAADDDEMTVLVEKIAPELEGQGIEQELALRFREALGVKLVVKAVGPGETESYTGLNRTSKIKRVIDRRKSA